MATRKLDIRYVAGIVDGEGCITIHVNRSHAARFANQQPRIVMQVLVSNCFKPLIDQLHRQFGGHVAKHRDNYNPRARDNWRWGVSEQAACRFVSRILPYLVVKRRQAELLIELGRLKAKNGQHRLTNKQVSERMSLAERCSELNKRGRV